MTKAGIVIRIGAARDEVVVTGNAGDVTVFDRAEMRKNGEHNLMGNLRREIVSFYM